MILINLFWPNSALNNYTQTIISNLHIVEAQNFIFLEGPISELPFSISVFMRMVRILQKGPS